MPRVVALRMTALLIAGMVWSVGCAVAGVDFYIASRSNCSEDLPPLVVTIVLVLSALGLRKNSLFFVALFHSTLAFSLFAGSVVRAFEGHVPAAHTVMVVIMVAIPTYVMKWRHCFNWFGS